MLGFSTGGLCVGAARQLSFRKASLDDVALTVYRSTAVNVIYESRQQGEATFDLTVSSGRETLKAGAAHYAMEPLAIGSVTLLQPSLPNASGTQDRLTAARAWSRDQVGDLGGLIQSNTATAKGLSTVLGKGEYPMSRLSASQQQTVMGLVYSHSTASAATGLLNLTGY